MRIRFPLTFRGTTLSNIDIKFLVDAFGMPSADAKALLENAIVTKATIITVTPEQFGKFIVLRHTRNLKRRYPYPMDIGVEGEPPITDLTTYANDNTTTYEAA